MDFSNLFSSVFWLSFLTLANMLAAVGGIFYVASLSMKTVIPLRIAAIASAFFLLCGGIFARSFPSMFLYSILLPLNTFRLYQMMELVKKVRAAASSDLSMDWLQPFMKKRKCRKGDIIFRKGDHADEMFLAAKGKYLVSEIKVELRPGQIFGELGLITSAAQRTASIECVESGHLLTISYEKVRQLYFDNPEFGFYFLRLIGERLLQNQKRAEDMLAETRQKLAVAMAQNPQTAQEMPGRETTLTNSPKEVATGADAIETTDARRDKRASELVDRCSLWSGAAGLVPIPIADVAAVGGVQLEMLRRLSQIYGVPFSANLGKSIIASLAGSVISASTAAGTAIGLASFVKSIPGIGTVVGALSMPVFSAGATYVIGKVFIQHFASGGTLLDFNPPDHREYIKNLVERMPDRKGTLRYIDRQ